MNVWPSQRRWLWTSALLIVFWIGLFTITHLPAGGPWDAAAARLRWPGADKLVHFAGFAVLGALVAWNLGQFSLLAPRRLLRAVVALLAVAAYAAVDEWLQSFVPGRTPDLLDWLADVGGAGCGIACFLIAGLCAAAKWRRGS